MVASAFDLLGNWLKSFILFIGLPELKTIWRPTTCTSIGVYISGTPVWVSPVWDRVWVTHFLASAMIISHSFAVCGSRSPCSLLVDSADGQG